MKGIYTPIPSSDQKKSVDILALCPCENYAKIRTNEGKEKWVMRHYLKIEKAPSQTTQRYKILRSSHYDPATLDENIFTDWRCFDDKQIETGDTVKIMNDKDETAIGKVLWVKQTTFGSLSDEDKKGHKEFTDDAEMYETYKRYYATHISPETEVKVLRIKINGR